MPDRTTRTFGIRRFSSRCSHDAGSLFSSTRPMPMRRVTSALAVSVALVLTGCTDEPPPAASELTTTVDTTAGVVHVRNAGEPPRWGLEQTLDLGSIGSVGEPAPDEFGRITSVLADADGNVYVGDSQAATIRVFSPDGRLLRSIGRSGSGPGEFGTVYPMAWAGDTIAVLDPGNARIATFTRGGEWAGSWRWQPLTGDVRFLPGGRGEAWGQGSRRVGERGETVFVRYTAAGPQDTLVAPQWPDALQPIVCPNPADGSISFFLVPFAPKLVSAMTPGGHWAIAPSAAYRIAITTPAGDTLRIIERQHQPALITDAEWDAETEEFRTFREEVPGARCDGEMTRPEFQSAIRHITFDDRGRMWVEATSDAGEQWDVFESDGRLLGTLSAPERNAERVQPYVRNDHLYLVRTDSLDVQHVGVYGASPGSE